MSEWRALLSVLKFDFPHLLSELKPIIADYVRARAHEFIERFGSTRGMDLISKHSVNEGPTRWELELKCPCDLWGTADFGVRILSALGVSRDLVFTFFSNSGSVQVGTKAYVALNLPQLGTYRFEIEVNLKTLCIWAELVICSSTKYLIGPLMLDQREIDSARICPLIVHSPNVSVTLIDQ